MFYNRYRCQITGERHLWWGGDTHAEAQERARMEAARYCFDHIGTYAQRWRTPYE